jgi:hypothetical protein
VSSCDLAATANAEFRPGAKDDVSDDPGFPRLPLSRKSGPPYIHVLAKPSGPVCNLHCRYCYFLAKENLYPGDRFRMSELTMERYIRQVLESEA